MSECATYGPHLDDLYASLTKQLRQLFCRCSGCDDIINECHMTIVGWCHGKRSLQILFSLLFVQSSLGWSGACAMQAVTIYGYL